MSAFKFNGVTELKDFEGETTKIQGEGTIRYRLYFDENYQLFIQIQDNELASVTPGTYSSLVFPVIEFAHASLRPEKLSSIVGRTFDGAKAESKDENMSGFLKAAIRDLLRVNE